MCNKCNKGFDVKIVFKKSDFFAALVHKVQNPEVCDATNDAMKAGSWAQTCLLVILTTGMIISSRLMPPCWNVFR